MSYSNSPLIVRLGRQWPCWIALLVTALYLLLLERSVLQATGGVFSYPLDDPFIHMDVARNLAFHGTWGVNAGEFGSASSSLLYTLLLTLLFKLFSVHVLIPFLINCVAAICLLFAVHHWLVRQGVGAWGRLIILLLLVFLAPLPILMIGGMEHVLQCLFAFLFLTSFGDWLAHDREAGARPLWPVFLYAVLITALRYEGLFLIAIACLLLLAKRKIPQAFALGFIAVLPVAIFGLISVRQGSYFLPNSVLMKSEGAPFSIGGLVEYVNNILTWKLTLDTSKVNSPVAPGISLTATQRLLVLLPLTYLFFMGPVRRRPAWFYYLIILTGCTLLHLSLAATGWFYRYEGYLVVCTLALVSVILYQNGRAFLREKGKTGAAFLLLLSFAVGFPFLLRSAAAFTKAKRACINIFQQQYQMGQFLGQYYSGEAVAANDIGAITYYGDIKIEDLWGLGSIEVARSKKGKYWTPAFLDSLVHAKGVQVAIIYETWFTPELTGRWTKIATWQIPDNVICGSDVVTFYAVDKAAVDRLRQNLKEFQPALPKEVGVVYY